MDILNDFQLESDAERGAELKLRDPRTGKELKDENGYTIIKLQGTDSPKCEQLHKEEERRMLIDGDDFDKDESLIRVLAGLIMGWSNLHEGENPLEFNEENKIKLLNRPWFRGQVNRFVETRTNFFLDYSEKNEKS